MPMCGLSFLLFAHKWKTSSSARNWIWGEQRVPHAVVQSFGGLSCPGVFHINPCIRNRQYDKKQDFSAYWFDVLEMKFLLPEVWMWVYMREPNPRGKTRGCWGLDSCCGLKHAEQTDTWHCSILSECPTAENWLLDGEVGEGRWSSWCFFSWKNLDLCGTWVSLSSQGFTRVG